MWPHRPQPTRIPHPWDSPGKNTGMGCHFLLQCMKVKSESEVAQLCPILCDPTDCGLPGSSSMGFSRQEYWSGVPLPSPTKHLRNAQIVTIMKDGDQKMDKPGKIKILWENRTSESMQGIWGKSKSFSYYSQRRYWIHEVDTIIKKGRKEFFKIKKLKTKQN